MCSFTQSYSLYNPHTLCNDCVTLRWYTEAIQGHSSIPPVHNDIAVKGIHSRIQLLQGELSHKQFCLCWQLEECGRTTCRPWMESSFLSTVRITTGSQNLRLSLMWDFNFTLPSCVPPDCLLTVHWRWLCCSLFSRLFSETKPSPVLQCWCWGTKSTALKPSAREHWEGLLLLMVRLLER